jgi:16S rRNA (guanine527-N7)-methyltransferase
MPGKLIAPENLVLPNWALRENGVSHETLEKLQTYYSLLRKWQATINLVGQSTLPEAGIRHFSDSLQILLLIPAGAKTLYDLGSGAGFPGLVLAIARPDLSVHLIESDQRKSAFLRSVSRETLTPVIVHNDRVQNVDIKESIPDVVTARALADLKSLLALTRLWWKENPQLVFIFPKGGKADGEIEDARKDFQFDLDAAPSQTDTDARILVIKNVKDSCE